MKLLPIELDEAKNERFKETPACRDILNMYPSYYQKIGFNPPWIGYFAALDSGEIVASGGFKGSPQQNKVEIAYYTFPAFEGKGIGTELCGELVLLALNSSPSIRVMARTLIEPNASHKILKRNGFKPQGILKDEDDGEVLEWEYQKDISELVNDLGLIIVTQ